MVPYGWRCHRSRPRERTVIAIACYPGTFNPPTVAHLAIAEAALQACGVEGVELVLSRVPIGKEDVRPTLEERLAVLEDVVRSRPWLSLTVTDQRHIAAIAQGYEVIVMGADKWEQVNDVAYYGSEAARDAAVASLPRVAVAPRLHHAVPDGVLRLDVDLHDVSSTAVREGRRDLMLPEAAASGLWS
jgi:nicotinic acid mononucleotide adenylyltransferase